MSPSHMAITGIVVMAYVQASMASKSKPASVQSSTGTGVRTDTDGADFAKVMRHEQATDINSPDQHRKVIRREIDHVETLGVDAKGSFKLMQRPLAEHTAGAAARAHAGAAATDAAATVERPGAADTKLQKAAAAQDEVSLKKAAPKELAVKFQQSTGLKEHEHMTFANQHLQVLAQLLDGMPSLQPHNQGQAHARESSSPVGVQSEEHKHIVVHTQEAFAYNGVSLFKQSERTVSPSQLPRVLHVTCKNPCSFPQKHSWTAQNPGWSIDFLTDERIEGLFRSHFPTKDLEQVAKFGVEKADIGRLLALEAEGGVYVDNDVEDLVPIDKWPEPYHYQVEDIDVILGVEFPNPRGSNPLQITNWAMAAKPGNALVRHVLEKIVDDAPSIPDERSNIISRTGPGALTSAVLQAFSGYGLKLPPISEFNSGQGHVFSLPEKDGQMTKVLILPYRAFGYPGMHGDDVVTTPYEQRLVKHWFRGSWK